MDFFPNRQRAYEWYFGPCEGDEKTVPLHRRLRETLPDTTTEITLRRCVNCPIFYAIEWKDNRRPPELTFVFTISSGAVLSGNMLAGPDGIEVRVRNTETFCWPLHAASLTTITVQYDLSYTPTAVIYAALSYKHPLIAHDCRFDRVIMDLGEACPGKVLAFFKGCAGLHNWGAWIDNQFQNEIASGEFLFFPSKYAQRMEWYENQLVENTTLGADEIRIVAHLASDELLYRGRVMTFDNSKPPETVTITAEE